MARNFDYDSIFGKKIEARRKAREEAEKARENIRKSFVNDPKYAKVILDNLAWLEDQPEFIPHKRDKDKEVKNPNYSERKVWGVKAIFKVIADFLPEGVDEGLVGEYLANMAEDGALWVFKRQFPAYGIDWDWLLSDDEDEDEDE